MASKLIDVITHSREVGTGADGKKKYVSTRVGAVLKSESGARMLVMEYKPVKAGGMYFLNEYEPKKAVELAEETDDEEIPF